MADIFISYSKGHAHLTEYLARELEAAGFTTWWDTSLLPGEEFPEQIKRELDFAQAVIVIWTESSVRSSWVCAEASRAYQSGKLITLHAEGVDLNEVPLPFNTLQSTLVTDKPKILAALASREVRPGADPLGSTVGKPIKGRVREARGRFVDPTLLAVAGAEWAQIKDANDLNKLARFAEHFAGTYYSELASDRMVEVEAAQRTEQERLQREESEYKSWPIVQCPYCAERLRIIRGISERGLIGQCEQTGKLYRVRVSDTLRGHATEDGLVVMARPVPTTDEEIAKCTDLETLMEDSAPRNPKAVAARLAELARRC